MPPTAMHADRRTFVRRSMVATAGLLAAGSAGAVSAADEPADGMGRVQGHLRYGGVPVADGADIAVAFDDGASLDASDGGRYERDLEPGSYTLTVDADGYATETEDVTVEAGETTTADFDLEREWGPAEGELEVAVVEPGGGSTLETRVTIFGDGAEHSAVAPGGRLPDGDRWTRGFEVPEGWWEVHAAGVDGYGDGFAEVYVAADESVRALVELSDEERTIARRGQVTGTVTDGDGQPIPDATVRLRGDRSTSVETTTEDGTFVADLAHGQYALEAFADGHERVETTVAVRFGRITERDVTLEAE